MSIRDQHRRRRTPATRRPGFTLAELLVTMLIAAIVLGGSISAILIAGHALPGRDSPTTTAMRAADVAAQMADELGYALHFTERTGTSVAFTVADRDADGSPERIRYEWASANGDPAPLTRQYNDDPAITVLDDVQQYTLTYDITALVEEFPGPVLEVETDEMLLSSYTGGWMLRDYMIDKNNWIGQYFRPDPAIFPEGTISWRVTRVRFQARRENDNGEFTWVQLRPADSKGQPTTTVLEQVAMQELALATYYRWEESSLTQVAGLLPGDALCLVLAHSQMGGPSAMIRYDAAGSGTGMLEGNDLSWTCESGKSLQYEIYGKAVVPVASPPQTVTRRYVTAVHLALETGGEVPARIETTIPTLNTPEALAGLWEAGFDDDPTALDLNGDGGGDWTTRGGGDFGPGSLVTGVWHADATLDTWPDNDFTGLTTAEVCFRSTAAGSGPVFWINADWGVSDVAVIMAYVELQGDGTQKLTVSHRQNPGITKTLATVPGLPPDFVDLRLMIVPDRDMVNVKVNGRDRGTYNYTKMTQINDDRFASILATGGNAEFDSVSVRVGESN